MCIFVCFVHTHSQEEEGHERDFPNMCCSCCRGGVSAPEMMNYCKKTRNQVAFIKMPVYTAFSESLCAVCCSKYRLIKALKKQSASCFLKVRAGPEVKRGWSSDMCCSSNSGPKPCLHVKPPPQGHQLISSLWSRSRRTHKYFHFSLASEAAGSGADPSAGILTTMFPPDAVLQPLLKSYFTACFVKSNLPQISQIVQSPSPHTASFPEGLMGKQPATKLPSWVTTFRLTSGSALSSGFCSHGCTFLPP